MLTSIPRLLTRPFLAVTLAASLVLSPLTAAPAQAHTRQAANNDGFIAAMVALGLIGIIIANENGKNDAGYDVPRSKRLPAQCLQTYRTVDGRKTLFGKRCLDNNFRWAYRLPQQCLTTFRFWRNGYLRTGAGYRPNCLARFGYRVPYQY